MSKRDDDRRKIRSTHRDLAVEMQIAHVADVLGLDALVLANEFGQPLAGVGSPDVTEVLASLGMWAEFNDGDIDELTFELLSHRSPDFREEHVTTQEIKLPMGGETLHLIALGRSICASIGLAHAAQGITRIHASAPN